MRVSDRTYALLKRAHTLSGAVPVALFVIAHLAVNSTAVRGPDAFNRTSEALDRLPGVTLVEVMLIALPIGFHVVLGILLANTDQAIVERNAYPREWMRPAQRLLGGFLIVFVLYHVWSTRLSPELSAGGTDLFDHMRRHLAHPGVLVFYALAVVAVCAHFALGWVDFARRWGLAGGTPSHRVLSRGGLALIALLGLVGLNAILAFVNRPARWLEPAPERGHVVSEPRR